MVTIFYLAELSLILILVMAWLSCWVKFHTTDVLFLFAHLMNIIFFIVLREPKSAYSIFFILMIAQLVSAKCRLSSQSILHMQKFIYFIAVLCITGEFTKLMDGFNFRKTDVPNILYILVFLTASSALSSKFLQIMFVSWTLILSIITGGRSKLLTAVFASVGFINYLKIFRFMIFSFFIFYTFSLSILQIVYPSLLEVGISNLQRAGMNFNAVNLIFSRFFTYDDAYILLTAENFTRSNSGENLTVHNIFLGIGVLTGSIAFLLFIYSYLRLYRKYGLNRENEISILLFGLLASLSPYSSLGRTYLYFSCALLVLNKLRNDKI